VGPMARVIEREGLGLVLPRGVYDLPGAMKELEAGGDGLRSRVRTWVLSQSGTPMSEIFPTHRTSV
jgi:hypothetical protein